MISIDIIILIYLQKSMDNRSEQDFKKKRQQFFINLRKNEREQRFNKRRYMNDTDPYDGTKMDEPKTILIVDEAHRQQIQKIINTEVDVSMFDQCVQLINSPDVMLQHQGVIWMRKILSKNVDPPIKRFVDKGLINKFMQYAKQRQFPQLKLQASWALTNVAAGQSAFCQKIVQRGGIELFVGLLHENQKGVVDQAIWGVGNIAADNIKFRDRVLKNGGMDALIKILQKSQNKIIVRNGAWAVTNLVRGYPSPTYNLIKQALPLLCKILKSGILGVNKQLISDIIWSLSYFTQSCKSRIQIVNKANVLDLLFKYALDSYKGLYFPAIKVIGNFSNGNQMHTQALISAGIFDLAMILLDHSQKSIRRQMCWILSNVAAGVTQQVQAFMSRSDLLDKIAILFHQDLNQIKRQICWIYANFGHLGNKQKLVQLCLHYDIMRIYSNLLNQDAPDILENVLETLLKLLIVGKKSEINGVNLLLNRFQECGGSMKLQALQLHQNIRVYEAAVKIIKKFYDMEIQKPFL